MKKEEQKDLKTLKIINKLMEEKTINRIGLFIAIIAFVIGTYFQINPPQNQTEKTVALAFFIIIITYVGLYFVINWVVSIIRTYINKINSNEKEIIEINKKLDSEMKFNNIDKRLSILEKLEELNTKKKKKGQLSLDPRIVILIILAVLMYLYLKALGVIR